MRIDVIAFDLAKPVRGTAIRRCSVNPKRARRASNRRCHEKNRSKTMNRYDPRTPRTLMGVVATVISAATLALAVVMPATGEQKTAPGDVESRVASERCLADGGTITSMDVVAARHAKSGPLAQARAFLSGGAV
jgi:hypothetical protein